MRNTRLALAAMAVLGLDPAGNALAQEACPVNAENYVCRTPCYGPGSAGTCLHRTVAALFNPKCTDLGSTKCSSSTPKPVSVISTSTVNTAINCGLAAVLEHPPKGASVDLSNAAITEDLTFTLVSNSGVGGNLSFGVPVFSGVSIGPSLSDLNKLENTSEITNSFKIQKWSDLKPKECKGLKSDTSWLSYAVLAPDPGQELTRLAVGLEYSVSRSVDGSISINILALKIGPQVTYENDKAQKVCLTFDFSAKSGDPQPPKADAAKAAPSCQFASSGGSGGSQSKQ